MNLKDLLELLYTARSRFSSLQMEWEYRYRADYPAARGPGRGDFLSAPDLA